MINRIAIINKSTYINNTNANLMTTACNTQLSRDVAPAWGKGAIPVTFYSDERYVPSGAAKIYIFDNADQEGALGYHTETMQGQVFGKVFAKTIIQYGFPILYNTQNRTSITVSSVLSHEVIELLINPYVQLWADGPSTVNGNLYSFEACDAVESNVYQITVSGKPNVTVSVSNFLYPEYFDTASPNGTKLDYMNLLRNPFSMTSGGYMVIRDASNNITEIFGDKYPPELKLMKL
jgi:hypothetical protein